MAAKKITINKGDSFDTQNETGCFAQSAPDSLGSFDGLDSDGVEVSFHVAQIVRVYLKPTGDHPAMPRSGERK